MSSSRSGSVRVRREFLAPGLTLRKNNSPADNPRRGCFSRGMTPPRPYSHEWESPLVQGRLRLASVTACEAGAWTILYWLRGFEGRCPIGISPYRCGSWRCRNCAWAVARDDYRRIERGVCSRPWWLYVVLTFDPVAWRGPWQAYEGGADLWDKRLRRRLEREYGRLEYLQTWERTLKGWPHLNLLLCSPALEETVRSLPERWVWIRSGNHGRGRLAHSTRWRRWLARAAPAAGFGIRVWVEIVDSREAIAAYLVKIAHELSRASFKAGDQRPLGAPRHFRRIRASRDLLPKRTKVVYFERTDPRTGAVTGALEERSLDAPSRYTGILSPQPVETWAEREPGWSTDVAEAMDFQANAWKHKKLDLGPIYE
jgi:hypothetical protein